MDSFVLPEPWDMPGYDSPVIMAAGAFTLGASIELSADAPLREPLCGVDARRIKFSQRASGNSPCRTVHVAPRPAETMTNLFKKASGFFCRLFCRQGEPYGGNDDGKMCGIKQGEAFFQLWTGRRYCATLV